MNNNICIIDIYKKSGKTTIIKSIISYLDKYLPQTNIIPTKPILEYKLSKIEYNLYSNTINKLTNKYIDKKITLPLNFEKSNLKNSIFKNISDRLSNNATIDYDKFSDTIEMMKSSKFIIETPYSLMHPISDGIFMVDILKIYNPKAILIANNLNDIINKYIYTEIILKNHNIQICGLIINQINNSDIDNLNYLKKYINTSILPIQNFQDNIYQNNILYNIGKDIVHSLIQG